jgi:asparagine synthase (glutamine-hydrolysing)
LSKRIPATILKRKKAGFPVPYDSWMRGELKDWLSEILLDRQTSARGYFRKSTVEKILSENACSGRYSKELFSLAVLELWHRQFLGCERPSTSAPFLDSPEPFVTRA